MKRDRGIVDTGWIPDNHKLEIYVEDGELHFNLICPPCCPSRANEHLLAQEDQSELLMLMGSPPPIEKVDGGHFQCAPRYEAESVGIEAETCVDQEWIEHTKKLIADGKISEGAGAVMEIEHRAVYGWSQSTWISESEYEWEFSWRPTRTIALVLCFDDQ